MPGIGPDTRTENLDRLERESFDLCVVGGGITGAGIALDAASRGLAVALVERGDFASGTSSKSSKLVHGGLRYLAQYELGLTWESVRERDLLRRLAPHLVRPIQFLYPVFRRGRESRFAAMGLAVYDVFAAGRGFRRHRRAGVEDVRSLAPLLDPHKPVAAWVYWDARTDDARLVLAILRAAHAFGAVIANYAGAVGFDRSAGQINAVRVEDRRGGRAFAVRARCVVNAAGVWASEVGALDAPDAAPDLRPAKGIHLVVPGSRLPLRAACVLPAGDRRSMFALPWGPTVVIGTTDTEYAGPLDAPAVDADDVAYALGAVNRTFGIDLRVGDVLSGWAGLRPLLAGGARRTADLSRRHAIAVSAAGLVTITGGKLTTYRRMAAGATDLVCERLGVRARCRTARIPLGITRPPEDVLAETATLAGRLGLDPAVARPLVGRHGDLAPSVVSGIAEDPALASPVVPGLSPLLAEIAWAFRAEMAVTLEDAMARRTRLALQDSEGGVANVEAVGRAAGFSAEETAAQAGAYAEGLRRERGALASPSTVP